MSNPTATLLVPIWALANLIIRINGSESLRPVLSGPTMAYLSSRVAFRCVALGAPPPVTYDLLKDQSTLINSGTDLQGDQPASFFLRVAMTSGGSYHCRARIHDREGVSNSVRLTVVIPPSETRVTSEPFPPVAYEGSRLVLFCNVSRGSHLSYSWFFNRREMKSSSSHRTQGNSLVMERVRPEHGGHYYCMAWSTVLDIKRFSSSREVQLTVKVYVTRPQISLSISKEAAGGLVGNISCGVSRGSPPINFTFLLENRAEGQVAASQARTVWFNFPIVPGLEMGKARCRAQTEVQDVLSEPLTLEVVPVGGHIKIQLDYFYRADHKTTAAKLSCQISQGTFPFILWLHNSSVLPSETQTEFYIPQSTLPFAFTDQGRTLVLAKLEPEVFGFYRCKVRDSYDKNGPWAESDDVLVQIKGSLNPCPKPLPAPPTAALPSKTILTMSLHPR
ncbi:Fc receptor-like protein 5 isoform X2 [Eucyclogobius newberryi]|uniref:Fc receptor-like protein 5 isoform X2 n=1 Tax=Eucyclogobius newberryi TaxID=166745 RepID=UPI003B5A6BCA